jgi:hypothetical protein
MKIRNEEHGARQRDHLPPEVLEALRRQLRVFHRVLDVLVAETGSDQPCLFQFSGLARRGRPTSTRY